MSTLDFLPSTTYTTPSPVPAHKRRKSLNTIIEVEECSMVGRPNSDFVSDGPSFQAASWLSPLSDHFPTPRGMNFMSAPIIPSSPSSIAESESSNAFSAPYARDSYATQATEFDDLYDVSSDEEYYRKKATVVRRSSIRKSTQSKRVSTVSNASHRLLPTLIIPADQDHCANMSTLKKFTSPVPPTPPAKVPMSPAIFRYLSTQDVPMLSATPSLDGSLTSEQLAVLSAPPTPDVGNDECSDDSWGGVQLQPAALATLQALSGDDLFEQQTEQVIEISQMSPTREMQQSPPPAHSSIHRHNSIVVSPEQQMSLNSLTQLDIPSPGGFFSSLSLATRRTWHMGPLSPDIEHQPSSTTAEHFYKTPWSAPWDTGERVIELTQSMSDGCLTARPNLVKSSSEETITQLSLKSAEDEEIVATEILDYDAGYVRLLQDVASVNIDRTNMWLSAQTTYLAALINPPEERDDEIALQKRDAEISAKKEASNSPQKKTVRFSEVPSSGPIGAVISCPLPKLERQESAYYRSFQQFANRTTSRDAFVHRQPRFEALQTQRGTFPKAHRNQLLGKYQLSVIPLSAKRRMSANVARGDEITPEDPEKIKSDKNREALYQMNSANWNVMASKMMNGGRLIAAPVAKRLARLSRMQPMANGAPRDRARILDLGGQATCDWAWHCATTYSNTKVYTVTTKAIRQLSNSNIRGPRNHRQVAVERLTKLPFKDNQFDLISGRDVHMILKCTAENGEDEYNTVLSECMRCLKPGGYLEYSLMDSDIINAGPNGQAKSVEFGFSLKTRGYDPVPTKSWLGRLHQAGFVNIKRAWLFLPMGAACTGSAREEGMGSTEAVASITGFIGSWAWEKWMLKLQMECGVEEDALLDGVYGIVEEGRKCGAGWRTLNGWARKPVER